MLILYNSLFFAALITSIPVENARAQVSVTLYYESLCPHSLDFILNELLPTYLDKRCTSRFKELNLIPFGIADVENAKTHKYVCQHGEAECQGNRFHSCAIKHTKDKKVLLEYLSCLAETVEVDPEESEKYPVNECLNKVPPRIYSKIMKCFNSEEGWKLLEKNGKKTKKFFKDGEEFVPYVSFNNEKNDEFALEALEDFKKVLCKPTRIQRSVSFHELEQQEEE